MVGKGGLPPRVEWHSILGGGKRGPRRGSRAGVPKPPFLTARRWCLNASSMTIERKWNDRS